MCQMSSSPFASSKTGENTCLSMDKINMIHKALHNALHIYAFQTANRNVICLICIGSGRLGEHLFPSLKLCDVIYPSLFLLFWVRVKIRVRLVRVMVRVGLVMVMVMLVFGIC